MDIHLLIVDDEWLDREGLRDQIMRLFPSIFVLHTAKGGAEALRLMEIQPIHILVSDIRMPQMTGLTLAEKAMELFPQILVVFVSGYDDFAYAQRAIQVRALWYLLKPVQDEELIQALNRCRQSLPSSDPGDVSPTPYITHEDKLCAHIHEYIHEHLAQPITLIQIAHEMHYTPNYLGRIFQETCGVNFSTYLVKIRMKEAETLLREQPSLRIREVSRLVGYTNPEAFSRAFYQEYGVSPLAFRNTIQP